MHSTRLIASAAAMLFSLLAAAASAGVANPGAVRLPWPHLIVTNATFDSITGFAIAPEGTGAFHAIDIGSPLQGGLTSITVDVPPGNCLRAVRVTFADGRTRRFAHIDVCRFHHLRLSAGKLERRNGEEGD